LQGLCAIKIGNRVGLIDYEGNIVAPIEFMKFGYSSQLGLFAIDELGRFYEIDAYNYSNKICSNITTINNDSTHVLWDKSKTAMFFLSTSDKVYGPVSTDMVFAVSDFSIEFSELFPHESAEGNNYSSENYNRTGCFF